jgi:tRNA 2-selenouridine synthase
VAATIGIDEFIKKYREEGLPVLDVRSEKEFFHGHFPDAFNLPLLNNEERIIIGTCYKQKGREAAVKKGFGLVGPRFADMISAAEALAPSKSLLLYCWRGGMRSNIMSWLLGMAGFRVFLLKGGYKSWRTWALQQFDIRKKIMIVGGRTGSGKTEMLHALSSAGEQVIDLEGMAHHKGSAFGALGQKPQPANEHFENMLALSWSSYNENEVIWIENESRTIGSNIIPQGLYAQMRMATVAEIRLDYSIRKKRILDEYGGFPVDVLTENTKKVAKRLGGMRLKEALDFLSQHDLPGWVDIMLQYYDGTYEYGSRDRDPSAVIDVSLPDDNMHNHVQLFIALRKKMLHAAS